MRKDTDADGIPERLRDLGRIDHRDRRPERLRAALHAESLTTRDDAPLTLTAAVAACLAFTYLNPHCWLDTVVLLGAIASPLPTPQRTWFGIGATCASFVGFFALGFGARLLRGVFARPLAWKILDATIALVMWAIAWSLLR